MTEQPNPKESLQTLHNILTEAALVLSTMKHPSKPRAAELVDSALTITNDLLLKDSPTATAAALGSRGGKRTAERGPEYFAKIAAMRKTRAGGRPRKSSKN